MKQVREQAAEFLDLVAGLRQHGHKVGEIAFILELHSSVLSSLCRTVLPDIVNKKTDTDTEDAIIDKAFSKANNISKDKTLRNLPRYIEQLKAIPKGKQPTQTKDIFEPYRNAIAASYSSMQDSFVGIYECYTHSTNSNEIRQEPFLVIDNYNKKHIEIRKGNTAAGLEGFMFLSGSHLISIYLIDSSNGIQETALIQLIQPFSKSFKILYGIYLNLSFSKTPIARRIVLKRKGDECSMEEFKQLPTKYFKTGQPSEGISPEIMEYLSDPDDYKMECMQLPNPTFDEQDLAKARELKKLFRNKKIED